MAQHELEQTARELIAEGKGILAADETVPTLTRRLPRSRSNRRKTAVAPTVNCSLLRRISLRSSAA